jgi:lysine biosynthesis protein LysW
MQLGMVFKEGIMQTGICPECEAKISVTDGDCFLFNRVACPDCGATLEVINERPLRFQGGFTNRGTGWLSEWLRGRATKQ